MRRLGGFRVNVVLKSCEGHAKVCVTKYNTKSKNGNIYATRPCVHFDPSPSACGMKISWFCADKGNIQVNTRLKKQLTYSK
jgi:hypothetical protein